MPSLVHFLLELTHLAIDDLAASRLGVSDAVSECILQFTMPNISPHTTWHAQKQLHSLLQPTHILKAWPVYEKNELLFTSLPENDSSPVLEAFTWFCVPLNINHNQKAPNLYKWQDTCRNQEHNLLYFLHPFPMSSNAIRFPKTQHWSGHTSNNLRGLPLVLSSHSRHKVHMWPQPTSKTQPLFYVVIYLELDCLLTALYCLPSNVVCFHLLRGPTPPLCFPLTQSLTTPSPPCCLRPPTTMEDRTVWRLQLCIPTDTMVKVTKVVLNGRNPDT